ncbi:hydroxymethylglutaryl-CoA lyase [Runella slithyformis]|uniref:Hydroxymethylglutaryl-CoA lyase n=1 Tax=Runella slithyformis (strain ATCC 29530 / DSM 19594 / LMG 11500 / NCIMB 11436 / LSU 4) TaxID=761193 RepID=A0A7U3ZQD2_RUNSL|nr:hydroxymethylglutaryl-CoA lyase [Runella slithyformis]AEI51456.1 Hydroxymethylglutaryl-CoA lyase [Runella slithyformis DSM 19594]
MKLIECPRDAMQGLADFVPTETKVDYLNRLLQVGFDTLDFGSFVSPKAIPQMRDTAEVVKKMDMSATKTKLLAIVANVRGAQEAAAFEQITYLGFPLSLSETFQLKNTNKTIEQAFGEVSEIQNECLAADKQLVVYLSMGFGNPYGDPYSPELVEQFSERLTEMGVHIIAPSDTIGSSTTDAIKTLYGHLLKRFPNVEFGAHLHAKSSHTAKKVRAAYKTGVRRIDCAVRGFGGCPLAEDKLVGNLATELVVSELNQLEAKLTIDELQLAQAMLASQYVFG